MTTVSELPRLPSIQGLRNSTAVTVTFSPTLHKIIETRCRAEWLELNRLDHPNDTASPFVPVAEWLATREGRTHKMLFDIYYMPQDLTPAGFDHAEANRVLSRLQAQRYKVQGTRKRFEARVHSATNYRKFRNWWINKHYSTALGLQFDEPCPFNTVEQSGPLESYIDIGHSFEEYSGHKLSKKAWIDLRAMEKDRLEYLEKYPKQQTQQLAA